MVSKPYANTVTISSRGLYLTSENVEKHQIEGSEKLMVRVPNM